MLASAHRRDAPVEYGTGDALALPFPDEHFDVAVCTQVYEYVEDIAAALAEARRVLRTGGRLLVLDTDWDSIVWHSGDRERMQRVLTAWNEHLADPYLPRRLPALLRAAGLEPTKSTIIPLLNIGADRNTFSAGMSGLIAAYVAGRGGVSEADASAWEQDLAGLGDDYFFSLNRYLFIARRS
jgi:SAM-dependent methyltransferase